MLTFTFSVPSLVSDTDKVRAKGWRDFEKIMRAHPLDFRLVRVRADHHPASARLARRLDHQLIEAREHMLEHFGLGQQPHDLSGVVVGTDHTFHGLAASGAHLAHLVTSFNTTMGALAARQQDLSETIGLLPPTLREFVVNGQRRLFGQAQHLRVGLARELAQDEGLRSGGVGVGLTPSGNQADDLGLLLRGQLWTATANASVPAGRRKLTRCVSISPNRLGAICRGTKSAPRGSRHTITERVGSL